MAQVNSTPGLNSAFLSCFPLKAHTEQLFHTGLWAFIKSYSGLSALLEGIQTHSYLLTDTDECTHTHATCTYDPVGLWGLCASLLKRSISLFIPTQAG